MHCKIFLQQKTMHPSHEFNNNCSSYNTPIPFSENDMSSFPKLDDSINNSLFNFPNSPHTHHSEYEAVYLHFYDLLYAHQYLNVSAETTSTNILVGDGQEGTEKPITKKRCSKKDRHSKINTMRGPRDRRMRLSLDVARKFFNLQDLLGFDKPSKTLDWLLKSSGTAIAEVEGNKSSNSESCEEVMCSSITTLETTLISAKKKKQVKKVKATVARESRIKARERARERTSQKKRLTEERNSFSCATNCDESRYCGEAYSTWTCLSN